MKRTWLLAVAALLLAGTAGAQSDDPQGNQRGFRGTLAIGNIFEGNINHEVNPVRSYGVVPSGQLLFQSSSDPAFVWGYELAANNFTGTDEWDRISHSMYSVWSYRLGHRLRFESGGTASWKGSSDDRELANEFGVSQRVAYKLLSSTRLIVIGSWRYKVYPDDPGTSGPSPYVGGRIDQRLPSNRRLAVGYKYLRRISQAQRDRYRRSAVTVAYSTPAFSASDRLSIEFEYRPQQYERLIKVGDHREMRLDHRYIANAIFERPLNHRASVRWIGGIESRDSNDADKRFFAPSLAVTVAYRVR